MNSHFPFYFSASEHSNKGFLGSRICAIGKSTKRIPCESRACVSELEEQTRKALELEKERKITQEEAERLDQERQAAVEVKAALLQHSETQIKNQENLVLLTHRKPGSDL